jgi:hypothetical protein
MIRHERVRPPLRDYPADEWNVIEKGFHPEFMAQLETILALGNGYLGMRGCPEEGRPIAHKKTARRRMAYSIVRGSSYGRWSVAAGAHAGCPAPCVE